MNEEKTITEFTGLSLDGQVQVSDVRLAEEHVPRPGRQVTACQLQHELQVWEMNVVALQEPRLTPEFRAVKGFGFWRGRPEGQGRFRKDDRRL